MTGADRDTALDYTDQIAAALDAGAREPSEPALRLAPSLADAALFFAYYARCRRQPAALDTAITLIDRAIEADTRDIPFNSLHIGVLKVAWVRAHLAAAFGIDAPSGLFRDINEVLMDALRESPVWPGHFDLMSGLAAFAVYFIEQLPDPAAAEALALIVDQFDRTKTETEAGVCWFTAPQHQHVSDFALTPDGHYAIGVAHGSAGVIPVLTRIAAAGIAPGLCQRLASRAIDWVLAQRRPEGPHAFARSSRGGPRQDSFYGWCWGDVGIAAALLSAGDRDDALEVALRAAHNAPARPAEPCVCHGASGNAHVFSRLVQAGRFDALRPAAAGWYAHALGFHASRQPNGRGGIGGFTARQADDEGKTIWVRDATFLRGSSGIGLSLLAAATDDVPPDWDRLLGVFF